MTLDQELQRAQQALASGNAGQCEAICRMLLQQSPGHPHASYLLAQVELQQNRLDLAVEIYRSAILVYPNVAELYCELGVCLARMNRIEDAIAAWQHAVTLKPAYAEALDNLGSANRLLGRKSDAIAFHERAIAAQPTFAQAHLNLGIAHQTNGDHAQALPVLRRALQLRPNDPAAFSALGVSFHHLKQYESAIAAYSQAAALEPQSAQHRFNLATALHQASKFAAAIVEFRSTLALSPANTLAKRYLGNALLMNGDFDQAIQTLKQILPHSDQPASVLTDLGTAYRRTLQLESAIESFQKAATLAPLDGEILSQLAESLRAVGRLQEATELIERAAALAPRSQVVVVSHAVILSDLGKDEEAIELSRKAIESDPNDAVAHFNLSALLLRNGDFEKGLEEYEWRWKAHAHSLPSHGFRQPQWDGKDLNGKRILLYAEQGFGDTIHFVRYASLVAQRGGKVRLACQQELQQLLGRCDGVHEIYRGDQSTFDVHFPLLSLPRAFDTRLESIPSRVPCVHADPSLVMQWRARFADMGKEKLKVGLVWARREYPPGRSIPLDLLGSLAAVDGVTYVSLQYGDGIDTLGPVQQQVSVVNASPGIRSFDDLAAAMMNIDLLITIDTAAAHLGGSLGIPVWTVLTHVPDWRWLRSGTTSAWYPTMQLFRQLYLDSWAEPLAAISLQLRALADNKRA